MMDGVGITLSALRGFEKKTAVTTNNVANVESDGYKSRCAVLSEGTGGGVDVEISVTDDPGPVRVVQEGDTVKQVEISNVDLAREMPEASLSGTYHAANLKVLSARDEMLGTVLDMVG
jgi:flagellar basal-body rod protein FlgC